MQLYRYFEDGRAHLHGVETLCVDRRTGFSVLVPNAIHSLFTGCRVVNGEAELPGGQRITPAQFNKIFGRGRYLFTSNQRVTSLPWVAFTQR